MGGLAYLGAGADAASVTIPANARFNTLTNLTISVWVLCNNFTTSTRQGIISSYVSSPGTGGFILRAPVNAATLEFFSNNGGFQLNSASSLSVNTVYHLAATCRENGDMVIYINGVQDAIATGKTFAAGSASNTLLLGNDWDAVNRSWSGTLWDLRLYGRGITDAEAFSLYAPQTRWDLYWRPSSRVFFDIGAGAADATVAQQIGIYDQQQSGAMVGLVYN